MASEWKPGDTGLIKEIPGGHILIGADAAKLIGLEAGTDGWDEFRVADDPIDESAGGGPHERAEVQGH